MAAPPAARIAAHFLVSSPPGQIAEVERDVLGLLPPGSVPDAALEAAWKKHNLRNIVPLRISSGGAVLACEEGVVGDNMLAHSSGAGVAALAAHHRLQEADALPDAPEAAVAAVAALADPACELLRGAVHGELAAYVARAYNPGGTGSTPWARGCEVFAPVGSGKLICYTSVVVKNTDRAYWAGSMHSRWEVSLSGGAGGKAMLSGRVAIASHYYESGNTQMHDSRIFEPTLLPEGTDAAPDVFAKAVLRAIADAEDGLQISLEALYDGLSGAVLKEMRRFLPVGGSRFDWTALSKHRMVKALTGGAGGGAGAGAAGAAGKA